MRDNFDTQKIRIAWADEFKEEWLMAKRRVIGTVDVYMVTDGNFRKQNEWVFHVKTPDRRCRDNNIIIQPDGSPGRSDVGWIEGKSITFIPVTSETQAGNVYCKINLADPTGWRTKVGTHRGERDDMPPWMSPFRYRMRLKATVKETRGTDAKAQVVLLRRDDHERMIQLFFAMRVWPQIVRFHKGDL